MAFRACEIPFPAALEEFRRRRFGKETENELNPNERTFAESVPLLRRQLGRESRAWDAAMLGVGKRPFELESALQAYVDYLEPVNPEPKRVLLRIQLALKIAAGAQSPRGVHPSTGFKRLTPGDTKTQLEKLCDEALVVVESTDLPQRLARLTEQRATAEAEMIEALLSGKLPFHVVNHVQTAPLGDGDPNFWRCDAAKNAMEGERIKGKSAVVLLTDLDAFFAGPFSAQEIEEESERIKYVLAQNVVSGGTPTHGAVDTSKEVEQAPKQQTPLETLPPAQRRVVEVADKVLEWDGRQFPANLRPGDIFNRIGKDFVGRLPDRKTIRNALIAVGYNWPKR